MPKPQAKKKAAASSQVNPLWGGHYALGPAEAMAKINTSIGIDKKLWRQDIAGSLAHAKMLAKQGIITGTDHVKIEKGLKEIAREMQGGTFRFDESLEDIHMNIEARLKQKIGAAAGRLHTARSRNDQVATDFRLWAREACDATAAHIADLMKALLARAEEHADTIMPGFTHLQIAQPVTLGHHLLAYVEMLERDRARFADARARMNESPLGACALAGTSFPIDRAATARELGFARPMRNSLDAVASRDFALEFLAAASILSVHLSRLAEEFILWCTPQFGFITLSEKFTSGSSIMPQKRNPDAAELVRGKTGRVIGNLNSLLITLKGLPLAYNKDLQEDKEPVFDAAEQLSLCLGAMQGMVKDFSANRKIMLQAATQGYATATDLADWLVQNLNIPFRDAHHITGRIVRLAEQKNKRLDELSLADLQKIEKRLTKEVLPVLSPVQAVKRRTSLGGTAPANVKKAIAEARKRL